MKNEIPNSFPYSHYGFDISFEIDDDHKGSKDAISWLEFMIKESMENFQKHCRSKKIRIRKLKVNNEK